MDSLLIGCTLCSFWQIDFGAPFPAFFAAVIRAKCNATPALIRDISLGKRFTAPDLLQVGLIDQIVPAADVQERALQLGNKIAPKSAQGPWGTIKVRDTLSGLCI